MNQLLFVLYVGFAEDGSLMPSVHYMTDKTPNVDLGESASVTKSIWGMHF